MGFGISITIFFYRDNFLLYYVSNRKLSNSSIESSPFTIQDSILQIKEQAPPKKSAKKVSPFEIKPLRKANLRKVKIVKERRKSGEIVGQLRKQSQKSKEDVSVEIIRIMHPLFLYS